MHMPNWISFDRSGPPLSALALRALHARYGDDWLVELLFDDCVGWVEWFWAKRRLRPLGLVALGSDAGAMASRFNAPSTKSARLESGMDNSPMYDGDDFDGASGLMRLYDVGMSSLVASELRALASLARSAFAPPRREHALLEARLRELSALIRDNLWDDESSAFVNRHPNGSFVRRVSPTSFYPLLAGIATDEQAARMVRAWLLDPARFCVRADGEGGGEADGRPECYWGLPSISADDRAFGEQDYWRGLVWTPTGLLVYLGLKQYDHVPLVRRGRLALVRQMREMVLAQWRAHRHVCENYSPRRDAGNCTGDRFHQWGALGGFISLLEAGHMDVLEPLPGAGGGK